jgi:hypothetical protein
VTDAIQNAELRDYLSIEAALEHWRQARGYAAVGCGAAEHQAFTAGWQAALYALDQAGVTRFSYPT